MKKIPILSLLLILAPILNFAQEQDYLPFYTPPSPSAYELGKYGQIPVGIFTGTPNFNLPLYEYKTNNLAIPITVSYSSNGIKVDQIESNVGLGWCLNAGGVITRIVRDIQDEQDTSFYPSDEIEQSGIHSPMAALYFYDAGNDAENRLDTETDLFMYNFQGKFGKFVYNKNKKIIQMPHTDMKIEPYSYGEDDYGYLITTSDGVKYLFSDCESTKMIPDPNNHFISQYVKTSWYLSKIIHPNGEEINFIYDGENLTYVSSISQTVEVLYPKYQLDGCNQVIFQQPLWATYSNYSYANELRLTEIRSTIPEFGKVKFNYGFAQTGQIERPLINISVIDKDSNEVEKFDFSYDFMTNSKRTFLDSIKFKDPTKFYKFEYIAPSELIGRLSYQQDHWGYYNGASSNNCLVPKITDDGVFSDFDFGANREPDWTYSKKGLLSNIIYPTKGSTELIYEQNNYWGKKITFPPIQTLSQSTSTDDEEPSGSNPVIDTIYSSINQRVTIIVNVAFNSHDCESYENTNKSKATLSIVNNSTNQAVAYYTISPTGMIVPRDNTFTENQSPAHCFADLAANTYYTVTLTPMWFCVIASSHVQYYNQPPDTTFTNIVTGGSRINKMVSHDPVQNKENVIRYYYGKADSLDKSSGDPGQKAYYITQQNRKEECEMIATFKSVKILSSSSLTPLFNTGNNNIYYKNITVSHGGDNFENGGEEYEYIIHRDILGQSILGEDIKSAPMTNVGWDNGYEKRKKTFKKNDNGDKIVLEEIYNHYRTDNRNYDTTLGYSIRKECDLLYPQPPIYYCTADDISKTYSYNVCTTDHDHCWFIIGNDSYCVAWGHHNELQTRHHPCYGHTVGYPIYNIDISNLDIVKYKNLSYWNYLDYSTTTKYDQNGFNPIISTTRYAYDNPAHIQLTRTETKASNGDSLKSKTYYPQDVQNQYSYMDSLISHYRIAEKIKEEKYVNGQIVSTMLVKYNDWGNNIYKPWYISSSTYSNPLEPRSRFYKIDNTNWNPLEFSKEDDVHLSYVWGYQKTKPVIEGKGVSFDDLSTAVNLTNSNLDQLLSSTGIGDLTLQTQRDDWREFNKNLRNQPLLLNAMITTYTYKPLVGLSSTTDPNGITTYYEYDTYGRLIFVRDNDYNIVKKYDYHYAGQ